MHLVYHLQSDECISAMTLRDETETVNMQQMGKPWDCDEGLCAVWWTLSMLNYHRKVHLFIHFALPSILISRRLRIFFSKTVYVMFVCRALTDSKYCQLFNRVKTSENISSNRKSVNCNIYNISYIYRKTKMTLYITSLISQMK